jgi:hypothetical protein
MPISINYKSTDVALWGAGLGVRLSAHQIDENFYRIVQAIDDIVDNPIQPDQITSVSLSGSDMYIHFESGQVIGPIAFPVLSFHWAGEWTALSVYSNLDVVIVTGVGLYLVLQDHTAAATFDEAREISSQPVYLKLFGFSGVSGVALADLTDVSASSPANGDFLIFSTGPNKWIAGQIPAAYVSNSMLGNMAAHRFKGNNTGSSGPPLDLTATQLTQELDVVVDGGAAPGSKGLVPAPAAGDTTAGKVLLPAGWGHPALAHDSDVVLASPSNDQALVYETSSSKWKNKTIAVGSLSGASALASDTDVTVTSPTNNQVLTYETSSSKWKNKTANLGFLSDVDVSGSLSDGDVFTWDGVANKWKPEAPTVGGGGSSTLAGDTDVNISSPANGQFLRYQTSDNKWHNSGLTFTLSGFGFTDVDIVSPANGNVLTYNSTSGNWENQAAGGGGSSTLAADTDVNITSPADQAPLIYDNATSKWIDGDPASLVPTIADNRISANISGGSARPVGKTISQILDLLSTTGGAVPYRITSGAWSTRGPATNVDTREAQLKAFVSDGGDPDWKPVGHYVWKRAVSMATTAALPACTYNNGTSGIGATLTGNTNGALSAIDGVTPDTTTNNSIMVKNQANTIHNGIYWVTQVGDGSHPFILTRREDANDYVSFGSAMYFPVATGTENAKTIWQSAVSFPPSTIGSDNITFSLLVSNKVVTVTGGNIVAALASVTDKDVLVYDSASDTWKNQRQHYDIAGFVPGSLASSQDMLLHRFPKGVTFPANFGAYLGRTSVASGLTTATASTTIKVQKASSATPTTFSDVGTIVFAAGASVATFTTTGGTTLAFAQGDVLRLQAPITPDATLSGVCATLVGYET